MLELMTNRRQFKALILLEVLFNFMIKEHLSKKLVFKLSERMQCKVHSLLLVDVVYQQSKLAAWVHESSGGVCLHRKENLTFKRLI